MIEMENDIFIRLLILLGHASLQLGNPLVAVAEVGPRLLKSVKLKILKGI